MKKVSVIVPVYNAEKTLIPCISSLLTQTISDIEIILVDDCSKDGSSKIIEDCKLQFTDKVIALKTDKNSGPGGARNLAISVASGEYIGFVDSDDLVVSTMYEKMYTKAKEENADIVDCGFFNEKEDNAIIYTSDDLTGVMDGRKRSELIVAGGYIWSKLFRSELLKNDKNCIFRENAILEDADFLTYLYATVNKVSNVKEILYKYTYNRESASNAVASEKYHNNIVNAINAIYDKTFSLKNYSEIQMAVEYEMTQMYLYGLINATKLKQNGDKNAELKLRELSDIREKICIPFEENSYICNKIMGEDLEFLKKMEKRG